MDRRNDSAWARTKVRFFAIYTHTVRLQISYFWHGKLNYHFLILDQFVLRCCPFFFLRFLKIFFACEGPLLLKASILSRGLFIFPSLRLRFLCQNSEGSSRSASGTPFFSLRQLLILPKTPSLQEACLPVLPCLRYAGKCLRCCDDESRARLPSCLKRLRSSGLS